MPVLSSASSCSSSRPPLYIILPLFYRFMSLSLYPPPLPFMSYLLSLLSCSHLSPFPLSSSIFFYVLHSALPLSLPFILSYSRQVENGLIYSLHYSRVDGGAKQHTLGGSRENMPSSFLLDALSNVYALTQTRFHTFRSLNIFP